MDLIRMILLKIEDGEDVSKIDGYDTAIVWKHLELLDEAGLIRARITKPDGGIIVRAFADELTWNGYEFPDSARNDAIWRTAAKTVSEKASAVPFVVLQQLLTNLLLRQVGLGQVP